MSNVIEMTAGRRADASEMARFLAAMHRHAAPTDDFQVCIGIYPNGGEQYWARSRFAPIGAGVENIARGFARFATEAANAGVGDAGQTVAIRVCGLGPMRKEKRPDEPYEGDANVVFASFIAIEVDARPTASLRALRGVFGEPTMLVESGGVWAGPDGVQERKVHVYYRLDRPARTDEELALLKTVRSRACRLVDADASGVSLGHPMRLPGTWHTKGEPKLCRIVSGDPEREISLDVALRNVTEALEAEGLAIGGAAAIARGERKGFKTQIEWHASDLRTAAAVMPNDGVSWEDWNTRGMAFWDASHAGADGLEAFIEWSRKDTAGRFDEGYCEARWAHWHVSPPAFASGDTLARHVRKEEPSWSPSATLMEHWFEPIEDAAPAARSSTAGGGIFDDDDADAADGEGTDAEPETPSNVTPLFGDRADDAAPLWVREMNKRHAFVLNKGQAMVANREADGSVTFSSRSSFIDVYANAAMRLGKKDTTRGEAWWAHPAREQHLNGVDFNPNGAAPGVFNLWRGFPTLRGDGRFNAANAAAGCARILRHVEEVVCSGDATAYAYLIRWLAHMVQRPGEKPGVAVIVRGGKGTGKDTLGEYVGRMLEAYYVHASTMSQLTGRFNGHLKQCLFLHAEELEWDGSRTSDSTLKTLITASTMSFEDKGVRPIQARSFTRVYATSNADWVVPASDDERRYLVLEASDAHARDLAWFGPIRDEMDGDGPAAFRAYLMSIDLSGFEVRDVPATAALGEQKMQSLGSFERWWLQTIESGLAFVGEDDAPWETTSVSVEKGDLRDRYWAWCLKHREPHRESEVTITKKLAKLTGLSAHALTSKPRTEGQRVRTYLLPSAQKLRVAWAELYD